MFGLWLSRNVLPVLTAGITIPLWLILAVGLWLTFDKASTVRHAVNQAVANLVHSAELVAERATNKALSQIIEERNRQADADRVAMRKFADQLAAAETENGNLTDAIALIESQPVNPACLVDQPLLDRLR